MSAWMSDKRHEHVPARTAAQVQKLKEELAREEGVMEGVQEEQREEALESLGPKPIRGSYEEAESAERNYALAHPAQPAVTPKSEGLTHAEQIAIKSRELELANAANKRAADLHRAQRRALKRQGSPAQSIVRSGSPLAVQTAVPIGDSGFKQPQLNPNTFDAYRAELVKKYMERLSK
jgi:hypothetical protein